jgi:hypothetical protein
MGGKRVAQYRLYACVLWLALSLPLLVASAHAQETRKNPPNIEDFSENSLVIASAKYLGATAESMAEIVDHAFSRYGMPSAIIRGEELSVSAMFGVRYGRGTLLLKDGREEPIYWRGPSLGVDMGATGSKSFALVYNIKNPEDLHKRIPGIDGSLIAIGGVAFHYLQRGNTVVAPMRVGVGYQVGISLGYVKFSPKRSWMPF